LFSDVSSCKMIGTNSPGNFSIKIGYVSIVIIAFLCIFKVSLNFVHPINI